MTALIVVERQILIGKASTNKETHKSWKVKMAESKTQFHFERNAKIRNCQEIAGKKESQKYGRNSFFPHQRIHAELLRRQPAHPRQLRLQPHVIGQRLAFLARLKANASQQQQPRKDDARKKQRGDRAQFGRVDRVFGAKTVDKGVDETPNLGGRLRTALQLRQEKRDRKCVCVREKDRARE